MSANFSSVVVVDDSDGTEAADATRKVTPEEINALQGYVHNEVNDIAFCCNSQQRASTSRCIMGVVRCFIHFADNMMYFAGMVFVPVAWILIFGIVLVWYRVFAPLTYVVSKEWFVFHAMFAHWLLINIIFNYFMVTITPPGQPKQVSSGELSTYLRQKGMSYCKKCENIKPLRAHHCSVCNKCVLKMDHHCPWTHNCIGHYNQRYFFLFMAYLWVGCVYVCLSMFDLFRLRMALRYSTSSLSTLDFQRALVLKKQGYLTPMSTFAFLLPVAVGIALGILLIWHIKLVSSDTTTIEFYETLSKRNKKNPVYLKQPLWKKWKRYLGIHHNYTILGVLFPWKYHPSGDGMTWEVVNMNDDDGQVDVVMFNSNMSGQAFMNV
eukprot:m.27952 g.27952  ORF g.27952 m.27952 type:complete len:379 (+) comp5995_c0_seq2:47-1183(+)